MTIESNEPQVVTASDDETRQEVRPLYADRRFYYPIVHLGLLIFLSCFNNAQWPLVEYLEPMHSANESYTFLIIIYLIMTLLQLVSLYVVQIKQRVLFEDVYKRAISHIVYTGIVSLIYVIVFIVWAVHALGTVHSHKANLVQIMGKENFNWGWAYGGVSTCLSIIYSLGSIFDVYEATRYFVLYRHQLQKERNNMEFERDEAV